MNNKIPALWVAFALVGLVAVLSAPAQDQSQGSILGQTPSTDAQGIRNYLLGPGDVLDVRVFGQPDLSSMVEIDADGSVSSLPFLETPIRAQCRTEREVQKDIATAYSKYIRNPQVSVRVAERKSRQPATVTGAVKASTQVTMMRRARLHEVLAKAGGWTERASGTIQIVHTQPEMCPEPGEVIQKVAASSATDLGFAVVKINDLKLGKEEADPYIRPGDIVIVTEGEPIYVTGAVMSAREIFMKDQLTLGRAIAMAGGPQRLAKTSEIHIYRQKDGLIGQEDLKYNYDAIRKGQQQDVPLKPYDIIDVRQSGALSAKGLGDFFLNMGKTTFGLLPQRAVIY